MSNGETCLSTRPTAKSETSEEAKPRNSKKNKERSSSEKCHYPFITKVQVRIKPSETESECHTTSHCARSANGSYLRSRSLTMNETSAGSSSASTNSYYECRSDPGVQFCQESADEKRRRRRKMLGKLASAPYVEKESQEQDELLYRPRFKTEDCGVQLLLVRELTDHLNSVSRNTRTAKRQNCQRSPVFHARATKGERRFGIRR